MEPPYVLILESITEINARLRILDEATARLEAFAERQLELLEFLTIWQEQMLTLLRNQMTSVASIGDTDCQRQEGQHATTGSDRLSARDSQVAGTQANRFIDRDNEYSRETHPALFRVIDLLEQDELARSLSVRQLAHQTGVSKSWCAIAKRYVLREEPVH